MNLRRHRLTLQLGAHLLHWCGRKMNQREVAEKLKNLGDYLLELEKEIAMSLASDWAKVKQEIADLKTGNASLKTENDALKQQLAGLPTSDADKAALTEIAAEAASLPDPAPVTDPAQPADPAATSDAPPAQ